MLIRLAPRYTASCRWWVRPILIVACNASLNSTLARRRLTRAAYPGTRRLLAEAEQAPHVQILLRKWNLDTVPLERAVQFPEVVGWDDERLLDR